MPSTAYQLDKKGSGKMTVILLVGVVSQVLVFYLVSAAGLKERLGAWIMPLAMLPLGVAAFLMIRMMSRLSRERLAGLGAYFQANGFRFVTDPAPDERAQFSAPLEDSMSSLGLETGAKGIQWFAVQNREAPAMLIFEHRFVRGTGKSALEHLNTVLIWPREHRDLRQAAGVRTPTTTASEAWFSGNGAVGVRVGGAVDAENLARLLAYARGIFGAPPR